MCIRDSLDIHHQLTIMGLLKGLSDDGKGIVIVLHDLRLAARFCSKVLVINEGKIVDFGEPERVLTKDTLLRVFKVNVHVSKNEITGNTIIDPLEPIS